MYNNNNSYLNNNRFYATYPNYLPNYYQPAYVPQQGQMNAQQMQQAQMQQRPYQAPIQAIKFLTADEMKAYIVMPASSELLVDQANNIAMLKSADPMGQSSSKTFKYEEINLNDTIAKPETPAPIDTSVFANKDDLKGFVTKDDLKTLTDKLDRMQKQIQINEIWKGETTNGKQE